MRTRCSFAWLVVALIAAPGWAGTLTSSTWIQNVQGIEINVTGVGTGTSTASSVSANILLPQLTRTRFVDGTLIDYRVRVTEGGSQAITATASNANADVGIPGNVTVKTAMHTLESNFMVGATTLVAIPLSNGKAGQFTGTFTVLGALHRITVDFYSWTPHTLSFTGLTNKGDPLPDVVAMGSFNLTGFGGGNVLLVSPSKVSIDGSLAQRRTASFTSLQLNFVPEPSALLLLTATLAAFARAGRKARPGPRRRW